MTSYSGSEITLDTSSQLSAKADRGQTFSIFVAEFTPVGLAAYNEIKIIVCGEEHMILKDVNRPKLQYSYPQGSGSANITQLRLFEKDREIVISSDDHCPV